MHRLVALLLVLMLGTGCAAARTMGLGSSSPGAIRAGVVAKAARRAPPDAEMQPSARDRKVIRTAQISIAVDDFEEAGSQIVAMAEVSGGFVLSSSRTHYTIKVPATGFTGALEAIADLGEVKNRSLSGEDVTAEYVDLEVRLKNAYDARDAYAQLLKKAQTVEEILKVEQALRETQERIELLEGRRKFLDEHLALSTINVHLSELRRRGPLMLLWDGTKWLFGKLLWL